MRTIERASRFKRDYKRESKGLHRNALEVELVAAITWLANDVALPARLKDHALIGPWQGYRDCHIKPDLVLIYRNSDPNLLELARIGSHSELGF